MEDSYNDGVWTEQEYAIFTKALNNRVIEDKESLAKRAIDYNNLVRKIRGEK